MRPLAACVFEAKNCFDRPQGDDFRRRDHGERRQAAGAIAGKIKATRPVSGRVRDAPTGLRTPVLSGQWEQLGHYRSRLLIQINRCRSAECLLLAQSGHARRLQQCPLLGVKRTLNRRASMSAFDPKRTFALYDCCCAKEGLNPHFAGRKSLL